MFVPAIPLGRLPGDIRIEGHTRVYCSLVLSVILSVDLWFVGSFLR
ncbi:MAG TPA: DUF2905 family protein [Planctomycetaceae bacterium]|jgi:hypothetical protein|nr:DUF2905 family protein [Planctomycetaceae bacterium]